MATNCTDYTDYFGIQMKPDCMDLPDGSLVSRIFLEHGWQPIAPITRMILGTRMETDFTDFTDYFGAQMKPDCTDYTNYFGNTDGEGLHGPA